MKSLPVLHGFDSNCTICMGYQLFFTLIYFTCEIILFASYQEVSECHLLSILQSCCLQLFSYLCLFK
jgi:hypothetical protein